MQNYKTIKEKVKTIEHKMGIGYIKTSDKQYTLLRRINMLCVIFMVIINTITLAGFIYVETQVRSNVDQQYVKDHDIVVKELINSNIKANRAELILIILGTLMCIAGIVLTKFDFHITGNIMTIAPIPYFIFFFAKISKDPNGFFGYSGHYFLRHFISYVFIIIFTGVMLFFAIRQQVLTRKLYKKILENIYEEYKKKNGSEDFSVSEKEWDEFVKNFDPRKKKIEL